MPRASSQIDGRGARAKSEHACKVSGCGAIAAQDIEGPAAQIQRTARKTVIYVRTAGRIAIIENQCAPFVDDQRRNLKATGAEVREANCAAIDGQRTSRIAGSATSIKGQSAAADLPPVRPHLRLRR